MTNINRQNIEKEIKELKQKVEQLERSLQVGNRQIFEDYIRTVYEEDTTEHFLELYNLLNKTSPVVTNNLRDFFGSNQVFTLFRDNPDFAIQKDSETYSNWNETFFWLDEKKEHLYYTQDYEKLPLNVKQLAELFEGEYYNDKLPYYWTEDFKAYCEEEIGEIL